MLQNGERLCPHCGSLPRTRRLWNLLEHQVPGKKVLHFSPSPSLRSKIQKLSTVDYVTTDYEGEFEAMKRLNIEGIDEPDHSYDIVICYHILEHIPDDIQAMRELYRITKTGGKCYIQTPFKEGDIYENPEILSPANREIHFGQSDHVRIYSVEGLVRRLETVGFEIEVVPFHTTNEDEYGFNKEEYVILANKASY